MGEWVSIGLLGCGQNTDQRKSDSFMMKTRGRLWAVNGEEEGGGGGGEGAVRS